MSISKEESLKQTLDKCFSDWEGVFDVDIEQTDIDGDVHHFNVIITHKFLGPKEGYEFSARVYDKVDVAISWTHHEFDYHDDTWEEITPLSIFQWLWFETVEVRV